MTSRWPRLPWRSQTLYGPRLLRISGSVSARVPVADVPTLIVLAFASPSPPPLQPDVSASTDTTTASRRMGSSPSGVAERVTRERAARKSRPRRVLRRL